MPPGGSTTGCQGPRPQDKSIDPKRTACRGRMTSLLGSDADHAQRGQLGRQRGRISVLMLHHVANRNSTWRRRINVENPAVQWSQSLSKLCYAQDRHN
jgi:hypothetical protein